jgi:hypothetical protein
VTGEAEAVMGGVGEACERPLGPTLNEAINPFRAARANKGTFLCACSRMFGCISKCRCRCTLS